MSNRPPIRQRYTALGQSPVLKKAESIRRDGDTLYRLLATAGLNEGEDRGVVVTCAPEMSVVGL